MDDDSVPSSKVTAAVPGQVNDSMSPVIDSPFFDRFVCESGSRP